MKRVIRFIKSLYRYILHGSKVSNAEYIGRISVCNTCDSLDKDRLMCKECGCYIMKKSRMNTEECPLKKW